MSIVKTDNELQDHSEEIQLSLVESSSVESDEKESLRDYEQPFKLRDEAKFKLKRSCDNEIRFDDHMLGNMLVKRKQIRKDSYSYCDMQRKPLISRKNIKDFRRDVGPSQQIQLGFSNASVDYLVMENASNKSLNNQNLLRQNKSFSDAPLHQSSGQGLRKRNQPVKRHSYDNPI